MCTKFIFLLLISNCNSFLIDCQTDIDCIHLNTFGRHKCFVKKCQSVDYLLEMNLKGGEVYEEEPHDGSSLPPNLIHDHDLTFPHDMSTAIQSGKSARKYEKQCIVFLYIIIKLQNVM